MASRFRCTLISCLGLLFSAGDVQAQSVKFQDVLQLARKEAAQGSTFLVYSLSPREEKTRKALLDSFKKKYGLADFRVEWLMLHQDVSIPRVISEIRGGRSGPDIFEPSAHWTLEVKRAGLMAPFDWVGTFGQELSGIQEAAEQRILPEIKGMMVLTQDATRAFVYNTNMLKPQDLPSEIDELSHPKWSRKFALGGTTSPFDLFSLLWGEERTIQTVKKLVANNPIFLKGTPAVVNAVAAGQAPVGLGSVHDTERLKTNKGAPIEWKTYGNLLPVLGHGFAITNKAPHPNLARLFTAWFATEGAKTYEEMEGITRVTREGSRLLELIKQRTPDVRIVEPKTQAELDSFEVVKAKLEKVFVAGR